jgi:predicted amidohydrolase
MGPASYDPAENADRIRQLVEEAGRLDADVLVFPELALSPYLPLANVAPEEIAAYAQETPFASLQPIFDAVSRARLTMVLPLVRRSGAAFFNSALVIDQTGHLAGWYDKAHLPFAERRYFAAGQSGFRTFDTHPAPLGVLICADRAFPEAWRVLALEGAAIVATPYNTSMHVPHHPSDQPDSPKGLREQQEIRMRASANLNGYFVVAAGKAGIEAGTLYIGDSMVISPWGEVLARAETDGDELVCAESDLRLAEEAQAHLALARKRRPDMYRALVEELRADLEWVDVRERQSTQTGSSPS